MLDKAVRLQLRRSLTRSHKNCYVWEAGDYLIYKASEGNDDDDDDFLRTRLCVFFVHSLNIGIHKNSIFCLSKLIKSNEWDFLRFSQRRKRKKREEKMLLVLLFQHSLYPTSESWFELILVDGA